MKLMAIIVITLFLESYLHRKKIVIFQYIGDEIFQ